MAAQGMLQFVEQGGVDDIIASFGSPQALQATVQLQIRANTQAQQQGRPLVQQLPLFGSGGTAPSVNDTAAPNRQNTRFRKSSIASQLGNLNLSKMVAPSALAAARSGKMKTESPLMQTLPTITGTEMHNTLEGIIDTGFQEGMNALRQRMSDYVNAQIVKAAMMDTTPKTSGALASDLRKQKRADQQAQAERNAQQQQRSSGQEQGVTEQNQSGQPDGGAQEQGQGNEAGQQGQEGEQAGQTAETPQGQQGTQQAPEAPEAPEAEDAKPQEQQPGEQPGEQAAEQQNLQQEQQTPENQQQDPQQQPSQEEAPSVEQGSDGNTEEQQAGQTQPQNAAPEAGGTEAPQSDSSEAGDAGANQEPEPGMGAAEEAAGGEAEPAGAAGSQAAQDSGGKSTGPLPKINQLPGGGMGGSTPQAPHQGNNSGQQQPSPAEQQRQMQQNKTQSRRDKEQQNGGKGEGKAEGEKEGEKEGEGDAEGGVGGLFPKIGSADFLDEMSKAATGDVAFLGLFGPVLYTIVHTIGMLSEAIGGPILVIINAVSGVFGLEAAEDEFEWPHLESWPMVLAVIFGFCLILLMYGVIGYVVYLVYTAYMHYQAGEWLDLVNMYSLLKDADLIKPLFDLIKNFI